MLENREIQFKVPQDRQERIRLKSEIHNWLIGRDIIPPVYFDFLIAQADEFISETGNDADLTAYIMIQINNQIWLPWLKGIPVEKRLLLLPKCLASSKECQAETDHIGLMCIQCNKCNIPDIESYAQKLGYVTLIAEGSPIVAELIRTGQVNAIVGVSCLDGLRKAFEHINNVAVPAIAVPLLDDGCEDTTVDLQELFETLDLPYSEENRQADIQQLRKLVQSWFDPENIISMLRRNKIKVSGSTAIDSILNVSENGKRYRPFITVAVYEALSQNQTFPDSVRMTAIAIEFFHKASLIHDDIEDNDKERYGMPTMNALFGNAFAINAGDYLIGTGYSILAALATEATIKNNIIAEIAQAHRKLTIGQGLELENIGKKLPLKTVIEIYQAKTSPAFSAAFRCGAFLANADNDTLVLLEKLSDALGVAYQIKDDLDDIETDINELSILNCFDKLPNSERISQAQKLLDEYIGQCKAIVGEIRQPRLKFLLAKIIDRIQR